VFYGLLDHVHQQHAHKTRDFLDFVVFRHFVHLVEQSQGGSGVTRLNVPAEFIEFFHAALLLPLQARQIGNRAVNIEDLERSKGAGGYLRALCLIAALTQPRK
jgi:hypothetical protein